MIDKLKFRVKTDAITWSLSADDESEEEGRRWVDAIAAAVAR